MRTFHIGGTASRAIEQSFCKAKNTGTVKYHQLRVVAKGKEFIVLNRNGSISINNEYGREFERYQLPQGAVIKVPDEGPVMADKIFDQVNLILKEIKTDDVADVAALELFRIKYLGTKNIVKPLFSDLTLGRFHDQ